MLRPQLLPAPAIRRDGESLRLVRRSCDATRRLRPTPTPTTPDLVPRTTSRCLATAARNCATATGRSSHAPAPASDRGSPRALRGCPYPPPEIGTAGPCCPFSLP